MTSIFLREIERLKEMALKVATEVESSLHDAWLAFQERDPDRASRVIDGDERIDQMEVDVEEECLKILALHQPVAIDLRFTIAVIKLNNDLERIGDLAVDMAERAAHLAALDPIPTPPELETMAGRVRTQLRQALDSLVNLDADLARKVCHDDDDVDALHRSMFGRVQELVQREPGRVRDLLQLLSVSRYLERIADHATNIAEDVIYLVEGEIVRHQPEL